MNYMFVLVALLFTNFMKSDCFAQQPNVTGVYYLVNIMETASGIKLDEDSTFQFFFSQGALDRIGEGRWSLVDGEIVLQSNEPYSKGFELVESKSTKRSGSVIEVTAENEMLLSFVHISITGTDQTDFIGLDKNGKAEFDKLPADQLNLYFELCPEKMYNIKTVNKKDNEIKIAVLPDIFDVTFDQLKLKVQDGYLIGGHPLLNGSDFKYEKN